MGIREERRQQRLAILAECDWDCARAAASAKERGWYSANTTIGDIKLAMDRTSHKRHKPPYRDPTLKA